MSVTLNKSLCIGCSICQNVCPKNAITMVDGYPEIDGSRCNDCGVCVDRCPKGALSIGNRNERNYGSGRSNYYGSGFGFSGVGGGAGRRMGAGRGRGMGRGGGMGYGPTGECICPSCGTVIPHQPGVPCYQQICPNCGSKMIRK